MKAWLPFASVTSTRAVGISTTATSILRDFEARPSRCYRKHIMRIVFMGAPDFAAPTLLEIIRQGHDVAAVYTRAPKPAGRRGLAPTKTPIHELADRFSLRVLTPTTLR